MSKPIIVGNVKVYVVGEDEKKRKKEKADSSKQQKLSALLFYMPKISENWLPKTNLAIAIIITMAIMTKTILFCIYLIPFILLFYSFLAYMLALAKTIVYKSQLRAYLPPAYINNKNSDILVYSV